MNFSKQLDNRKLVENLQQKQRRKELQKGRQQKANPKVGLTCLYIFFL